MEECLANKRSLPNMWLTKKGISEFSCGEVGGLLLEKGLEYLVKRFALNKIDGGVLQEMDDFDLVLLEVEKEHWNIVLELMEKATRDGEKKKAKRERTESDPLPFLTAITVTPPAPSYVPLPKSPQKKLHSPVQIRSSTSAPSKRNTPPLTFFKKLGMKPFASPSPPSSSSPPSPDLPPSQYSETHVYMWLTSEEGELGLGRYADMMYENCVDGEALLMLTTTDLRSLGVCFEDVNRFQEAIQELKRRNEEMTGQIITNPSPSSNTIQIKISRNQNEHYHFYLDPEEKFSSFSNRVWELISPHSPPRGRGAEDLRLSYSLPIERSPRSPSRKKEEKRTRRSLPNVSLSSPMFSSKASFSTPPHPDALPISFCVEHVVEDDPSMIVLLSHAKECSKSNKRLRLSILT